MPDVRVIEEEAFCKCTNLEDVEFGDKLGTIRGSAFYGCASMKRKKYQN